jgi:hypothetical protein
MPTTGAAPPAALSATYSMRFPLAEALASARAAKPPAAADAAASPFAAEQEKLRQTLAQLENAKTDINEQRKEAAREKIARIKARLAALRLAGGDPKKIAREVARLARELAAVARDYAGADGGAADSSGVFSQSPAGAAIAAAPAAAGTETGAQAAEPPAAQPAAAQDDGSFAREARRLLDELKNLMRGAKRRRAGKHGDADAAQANDALRSAEQAVSGLAAAFPSGAPSFAVSV